MIDLKKALTTTHLQYQRLLPLNQRNALSQLLEMLNACDSLTEYLVDFFHSNELSQKRISYDFLLNLKPEIHHLLFLNADKKSFSRLDDEIKALRVFDEKKIDITDRLVGWVSSLKGHITWLADLYIELKNQGFDELVVESVIVTDADNPFKIEKVCEYLQVFNKTASEAELMYMLSLLDNPLVFSAAFRQEEVIHRSDELSHLKQIFSGDFSKNEAMSLLFNLLNQYVSLPCHQPSLSSTPSFSSQEFELNDSQTSSQGSNDYEVLSDDAKNDESMVTEKKELASRPVITNKDKRRARNITFNTVVDYLKSLPIETADEFNHVNQTLREIKVNGLSNLLWNELKYEVAAQINKSDDYRIYDNFEHIMAIVESAKDVDFSQLDIRDHLKESKGAIDFSQRELVSYKGPMTRGKKRNHENAFQEMCAGIR